MDTSENCNPTSIPSPVPHLADKNYMPTTSIEKEVIEEGIGEAEKELSLVEEQLNHLAQIEQRLKARKEVLIKYRGEHIRLKRFNPTYYLPKEIWMEIFLHHQSFLDSEDLPKQLIGLPKHLYPPYSVSPPNIITSFNRRHGPLLLASICRRWRENALDTAGLWSKIRILLSMPRTFCNTLELLDLWHARSREAYLDIQLLETFECQIYEFIPHTERSGRTVDILQKLATQSYRWDKVYLVAAPTFVSRGLSAIKGNIPNLTKCVIRCADNTKSSWLDRELAEDMFHSAPKLDMLVLDNTTRLLKGLTIPYQQLTSLNMTRCLDESYDNTILTPADCIKLLRGCTQLKRCKLTCGYWEGMSVTPLTHPTLEDLSLYGTARGTGILEYNGIGLLLEDLTTPQLHILALELPSYPHRRPSSWNSAQLSSFLQRCPNLHQLSITTTESILSEDAQDYIQYLLSSPSGIQFDFWLPEDIADPFLAEIEEYLYDEAGALSWLPERIYYAYVPGKEGHMVVGTKKFFSEEDGGYVNRISEEEVVQNWRCHACWAKTFQFGFGCVWEGHGLPYESVGMYWLP